VPFNFIKLKEKFFFETYRHLIEYGWPHRVLVYEDTDTADGYYTMVVIAFYDELRYFRHMHIPLPRLKIIADGNAQPEYAEFAKLLLDEVNSNEAIRVPRTIYGKVPIKDIYDASK